MPPKADRTRRRPRPGSTGTGAGVVAAAATSATVPPLAPLNITPRNTRSRSQSRPTTPAPQTDTGESASTSTSSSVSPLSTPASTPTPESTPESTPTPTGTLTTAESESESDSREARAFLAEVTSKIHMKLYGTKKAPASWPSTVWQSFEVVIDVSPGGGGGEVGAAQCQRCGKCLAFNDAIGISSLSKHLRSKACSRLLGPSGAGAGGGGRPVLVAKSLKSALHNKLAEKCARDLSSLHSATGPGMAGVVQAAINIGSACPGARAEDVMPCANTVRNRITDLAAELRAEVMQRIKEAINDDRCSATTDMWTDEYRTSHYLNISVQFTSPEYKLENWNLCTPKFPCDEATTAVNIKNAIFRRLAELGLTAAEFEKLEWVTDQGSNIVKGLETSRRDNCFAHLINTVLKTSLNLTYVELRGKAVKAVEEWDEPLIIQKYLEISKLVRKFQPTRRKKCPPEVHLRALKKNLKTAQPQYHSFNLMMKSVLTQKKMVFAVLRVLERHDLIAYVKATSTQALEIINFLSSLDKKGTVAGSDYNKLMEEFEPTPEDSVLLAHLKASLEKECALLEIFKHVKGSKELVTYLKTSAFVNELPTTVKQEVDTRWNSLFTMLDSLLAVYDEVVTVLTKKGEADRLIGIQREELTWLAGFLQPFKVHTDHLQGDQYPTLPLVLLATDKLRKHCEPNAGDSYVQALLRERTGALVKDRLKPTMNQMVATFLWPKFRKLPMLEPEEREKVYDHVRAELARMPRLAPPTPPRPRPNEESPSKRPRLALDAEYDEYADLEPAGGSLEDEVDAYLKDAPSTSIMNLLSFWKTQANPDPSSASTTKFPGLSKLAHRVLHKPATSAPSERAFSSAGFLIAERRTRLAADLIDDLLFLHSYLLNSS
ncbi:Transposable element Hobo transposase [Frankliniella fusca]|uniref:Transposable element Hobo transposase n=1 Tax=Frankliniella fusca TaxID=407009 RepID=A0AAE1HJC8_9NEOP|nr:Transposable element Hobo transposase [Frankliniella fusca]